MSMEETYRQISLTKSKKRQYELYRHLRKLKKKKREGIHVKSDEPSGTGGKTT